MTKYSEKSAIYSRDKKDTDPYDISPIEMRSLGMKGKYVKSTARLMNKD